jgi:hypothetical protein
MPLSNIHFRIASYQYPDSLSSTSCIKVATVLALALAPSIETIYVFNIYEPVFDGLKFRLKQPLKPWFLGDVQNRSWENSKAVVNLKYSLAFSLHDNLKTLMRGS